MTHEWYLDEVLQYIKEGKVDFIVFTKNYPEEILEKYELVCEVEHEMCEGMCKHLLFEKKWRNEREFMVKVNFYYRFSLIVTINWTKEMQI